MKSIATITKTIERLEFKSAAEMNEWCGKHVGLYGWSVNNQTTLDVERGTCVTLHITE